MLKFECSECRETVEVPLEGAGKKAPCPHCKAVVVAPLVEGLQLDAGTMQVKAADDHAMAAVAEVWPYPIRRVEQGDRKPGSALYELPMLSPDGKSFGVAMAVQVAVPATQREMAYGVVAVNRFLLAGAIAALHREQLGGLVFPMTGLFEAEEGLVPALGLFIRASAPEGESLPSEGTFDDTLGPGTTQLFEIAMSGVRATVTKKWPLLDVTELSIASPLALTLRWCDFFYLNGAVFSVKLQRTRKDPGWDVLYAGGVRRVIEMPVADPWPVTNE